VIGASEGSRRLIKAPLVNIHSSYPLELVCIDFLSLEPSKGNVGNVLVITDHYTKFAKAVPTKNQTAKTTAEALFNEFIVHFGIPARLHSDQGANFESDIVHELCHLTNMRKSHTTPYHPMGNAGPERFNRTLLSMLGTLEEEQKKDWKKYINALVYYYNCTPHETTRISPFELLFGRKPQLPVDVTFGKVKDNNPSNTTREYIEDLQERMAKAHQIVQENTSKSQVKQKKYYDRKAKTVKITVGDKVVVRKLAFSGKHKIQDRFESDTYVVIEQPRLDIPVFKIKSEQSGLEKTLHRNHLLLVDYQGDEEEDDMVEVIEEDEMDPRNKSEMNRDASNETDKESEKSDVAESNKKISDVEEHDHAEHAYQIGDAHHPETSKRQEKTVCSKDEVSSSEDSSDESDEEWRVRVRGEIFRPESEDPQ